VLIFRRNNCIYATLGTCYSVWMTVWYAEWNETVHTRQSSIQGDKYQCRINIEVSPDDGYIFARNIIIIILIYCNWVVTL